MKLNKTILILGSSLLLTMASSNIFATTILKLSHNQTRNHPVNKAMMYMAKAAKAYSNGDLIIRIYPDSQLGTQRESLELLQNGAIAMAKSNAAELEAFAPAYGVFNLPYIFKDRAQYYRVMQGEIGESILQSSKDKGFIGLTFYDAGARSFYAKKPIRTPNDLKGLKVRVQLSQTAIAMVEALGGHPTPLAYGELYTALQQGVVDAAENNITALTINRHGEVAKFYSLDEHTMVPDVLVISTKVWNNLSKSNQVALKRACDESMLKMKELWTETENTERLKAIKMGVTFIKVDKAPFVKAVQPMIKKLTEKNPLLSKLVEDINQVR
ncbi:TRAP transporter substrate-binding protein [Psychromonas sp. CD1]|uniref:TRAP transporter substrate-binding protein n=1 Tax=Psychromonas sp. CD1 TaxID=1979839 RepID=UPI000B9B4C4D|nr:TRAP transporter substrate-binding protein [Psychromonas sp. CD1]